MSALTIALVATGCGYCGRLPGQTPMCYCLSNQIAHRRKSQGSSIKRTRSNRQIEILRLNAEGKFNQLQIAAQVGCTPSYVCQVIRGKNKKRSNYLDYRLGKCCKVCDRTISDRATHCKKHWKVKDGSI